MEKVVVINMIDPSFWYEKRVFLTGHTGFKGGWTAIWLKKLGAVIKGYSLSPSTEPSFFSLARVYESGDSQIDDIRDLNTLKSSLLQFKPDIVIHMAAQPLVRASYINPVDTYQTNVMGVVHLFEAIRECSTVKAVVNVTSDKCYRNNEWLWGYRENEPMGGDDPYSSSKACSELITDAYRRSFFDDKRSVSIATARAGNVIGGGDWSKDRLVPDAIRAFTSKKPLIVRNPHATRPWQHVLEPIFGYLKLAEKLYSSEVDFAQSWNFGPFPEGNKSVAELLDYMISKWPSEASWRLDERQQPHEAQMLMLDISKAKKMLKWSPRWTVETAIDKTLEWYQYAIAGKNMSEYSVRQINEFEQNVLK